MVLKGIKKQQQEENTANVCFGVFLVFVCLFIFLSFFLSQSEQYNSIVNGIYREQF